MTDDVELHAPRRPRRWGKVSSDPDDRRFLAGPRPRLQELWWAVRILCEFIRGFRALHFVGPCVTVFGSARFREEHRFYDMARRLGALLARDGFTVMTGDMELHAPNRRRWGKASADPDDRRFLAGPRPRLRELGWAVRIFCEFIRVHRDAGRLRDAG